MKFSKFWFGLVCVSVLAAPLSCAKIPSAPAYTLSEAEQKLVKVCKDEYKLDILLMPVNDTLWVYVPSKEPVLDLKATATKKKDEKAEEKKAEEKKDKKEEAPPKEVRTVRFLEGKYEKHSFLIQFDIAHDFPLPPTYSADLGYGYESPEKFQKNLQDLPTAIARVFGDMADAQKPKFFILVFADIVKGLEYRMTFYFPDLMRGVQDPSFTEEYRRRVILDGPRGRAEIIGDSEGKYLAPRELSLPEFLSQQMCYRIRNKYQQSSFPPTGDDTEEVLKIVHDTVKAYYFTDFNSVRLIDLRLKKTSDFRREQLATFSR